MKLVPVDGDKFRVVVFYNEDDKQLDMVSYKGKKWHKAAEIKLRAKEKLLYNQGFIYQRNKWEN